MPMDACAKMPVMSRNQKVIKLDAEIVRMQDRIAQLKAEVEKLVAERNSIHREGTLGDEQRSAPDS